MEMNRAAAAVAAASHAYDSAAGQHGHDGGVGGPQRQASLQHHPPISSASASALQPTPVSGSGPHAGAPPFHHSPGHFLVHPGLLRHHPHPHQQHHHHHPGHVGGGGPPLPPSSASHHLAQLQAAVGAAASGSSVGGGGLGQRPKMDGGGGGGLMPPSAAPSASFRYELKTGKIKTQKLKLNSCNSKSMKLQLSRL